MNTLIMSLDDLKELFLTLPAIRGIREAHPKSKISLVLSEKASKASNLILPFVDQMIPLPLSFFPDYFFLNLEFNGKKEKSAKKNPGEELNLEVDPLSIQRVSFYERTFLYRLLYQDHFIHHLENQEKKAPIQFKEKVNQILNTSFDQLINFSSHSLSGWLSFFIKSKNKIGLHYNPQGLALFGNAWLRHKNEMHRIKEERKKEKTLFHPSDVYYYGAEIKEKKNKFYLQITDLGKSQAKNILSLSFKKLKKVNLESHSFFHPQFVLFQPFSEKDLPKHEDLIFFKDLLKRTYKNLKSLTPLEGLNSNLKIENKNHNVFFLLIDDNNSKSHYLKILEKFCLKEKIPVSFISPSLEGLLSLASEARLCFLRGNTIFQRISTFIRTRSIEFYWEGESQDQHSFQEKNIIVEAKKYTFRLSDLISFILNECLFTENLHSLEKNLKALNQKFENQIKIYKILSGESDFYTKLPILFAEKIKSQIEERNFSNDRPTIKQKDLFLKKKEWEKLKFIQSCFERLSWKLYFEKEHLKNLSAFGSESLKIIDLLKDLKGSTEFLSKIENQSLKLNDTFEKVMKIWLNVLRKKDEISINNFLIEWKKIEYFFKTLNFLETTATRFSSPLKKDSLSSLPKKLNDVNLSFLRRIQTQLDDYSKTNQIQLKLIRSAKLQLKEEPSVHENEPHMINLI